MHSHGRESGAAARLQRFVTDTWTSYVQNQVTPSAPHADPRQFITTNTTHWGDQIRSVRPQPRARHGGLGRVRARRALRRGSMMRCSTTWCAATRTKDFWLMETQPAFVNWWPSQQRPATVCHARASPGRPSATAPTPSLYWQWRSALNGQEQYHGTLLGAGWDAGAGLRRRPRDRRGNGASAAPAIAGTSPHSRVAMLQSYDSRWAIDFQRQQADFERGEGVRCLLRAAASAMRSRWMWSPPMRRSHAIGWSSPRRSTCSRRPRRGIWPTYVRAGGHLVLGPRSGMKDAYDALWPQRQPGPLTSLLGGRVEQYYALDAAVPVAGVLGSGQASIWAEALSARDPAHAGSPALRQEQRLAGRQARDPQPPGGQGQHHLRRGVARPGAHAERVRRFAAQSPRRRHWCRASRMTSRCVSVSERASGCGS